MRMPIRLKLTGTCLIVMVALAVVSGYASHVIKKIFVREIGKNSVLVVREVFKRMDQRLYLLMQGVQIHAMGPPFLTCMGEANMAFEAMGDRMDGVLKGEDAAWGQGRGLYTQILANPASEHLRELYLTNFNRLYGYSLIHNVVLTNRYGAVVAMAAEEMRYDRREEAWWRAVRDSGRYVGSLYRDGVSQRMGLDLALAVKDNRGQFAGALLVRLDIRQVIREAEVGVRPYASTRIDIVTPDGRLLYSTTPHRYLEEVRSRVYYPHLAGGDGYFVSAESDPRIYAFARSQGFKFFDGLNWIIVISHRMDEVLGSYRQLNRRLMAFALFMLCVTLALVLVVGARVTAPLNALMAGIQTLASGRYGPPVTVTSRDEFGDLARAFNEMVDRRQMMESDLHFAGFAMDHASDAAFWVTPGGVIRYVNIAACALLGYDRSELLGASVEKVNPDLSEQEWTRHWDEVKKNGNLVAEQGLMTKEGRRMPFELVVNHMEFRGREYLCAFGRDITDRKRAEAERQQMERRLRQAQKMEAIGTLAGGIAHDFNNILSVVLGYADMAAEEMTEGEGTAALEDIREVIRAGNRARNLVTQILAFSRQAETEFIAIQPASIIKEGLKMLRASIPTTITIEERIDPNCGVIVADPTQVNQVLINLCTNAFHVMEAEGGLLLVELQDVAVGEAECRPGSDLQPGRYVRLTVQDTGPGIPAAIQERIFEPYFTTKEVGKGTGMGLAIVHGIMKGCGGFVTVESSPGEGATFRIFFPISRETVLLDLENGRSAPGGSERILLVDDEPYLAEMGKTMLERLGYRVTVAGDGSKGWRLFKESPDAFDLVITDQTMPEMTGAVLSEQILKLRPGFPIILCTGYSAQISEGRAREMGVRAFALKPLVKHDLAVLIRKVLDEQV